MSEQFLQERVLANEISILRRNGEILNAIGKCKDGIRLFPKNNFFHKILGDLYFQNGDFEEASQEYVENLKLIGDKPHLFKVFIRFFRLFESNF